MMFYFVDVVCPTHSRVPVTSYVNNKSLFNEYKSYWSGTSSETGGLDLSLVVRHFLYLKLSSFRVGFGHIICRICHSTTHDLDCAVEYTKSGVKTNKQKNYEKFIAYLKIVYLNVSWLQRSVHVISVWLKISQIKQTSLTRSIYRLFPRYSKTAYFLIHH